MESVILKNKLFLEFYIKDKYISLKEIRKLKKGHSLQRPRKVKLKVALAQQAFIP